MTPTPEVHAAVRTVIENHTVFQPVVVNDLKHVLGVLVLLIPTGAALSLVHWVTERDKLSASQNRLIALAYAVVAAVVFCVLNHEITGQLFATGNLEAFSIAFVAVAGSAQKTFDLLTAVSKTQPKATVVEQPVVTGQAPVETP